MLRYSKGLSAPSRIPQNHDYASNMLVYRVIDKMIQATSNRLVKGMIFANVFLVILIAWIDITTKDMSYEVWYLSLVFMVLLGMVYLVTILKGRWNSQKKRIQNSRLITISMLLLITSGILAFYQNVFIGIVGLQAYTESLAIAGIFVMATILPYVLGIKDKISSQCQDISFLHKVRHISKWVGRASYGIAIGVVICRMVVCWTRGDMLVSTLAEWITLVKYLLDTLLLALVVLGCAIGIQRELKKGLKMFCQQEKRNKFGDIK